MTTELYPHQKAAIYKALPALRSTGGFYLAHGVGTGKTLTAITLAKLLKVPRVLVLVGPKVALGTWTLEFKKWWPDRVYTDLWNVDALVGDNKRAQVNKLCQWLQEEPSLLIFDEAHYGKSPSAKRTRVFWKLADAAEYRLLLSGTPEHNLLDYWSQYRIVCPDEPMFHQRYAAYKNDIAILGGPMQNWVDRRQGEGGFKFGTRQRIAETVAPYTDWFSTEDLHLPDPIYTQVPVVLGRQERQAYDAMRTLLRAEIQEAVHTNASTALVKAMRLHQISSGHATDEQGVDRWLSHSAKLDALEDLLRDRQHQKIVIACKHIAEIEAISGIVEGWVIDGATPQFVREQVAAQFQSRAGKAIIVMQPRSGGVSIDLTAADCLINYSMEPSSIVWRQLVGRVWRMGQTGHVQILTLTAEGTVDEPLYHGLMHAASTHDLASRIAAAV